MTSIEVLEGDIIRIRDKIEKSLTDISFESEILDMIKILSEMNITKALMKKTKIVSVITQIQKLFPGKNAVEEAKNLIVKWTLYLKKVKVEKNEDFALNATKNGIKSEKQDSNISQDKIKNETLEKQESQDTFDSADIEEYMKSIYNNLSPTRKKVVDLLQTRFLMSTQPPLSIILATNLEAEINKRFDSVTNHSDYHSKAQTLLYNIKKNEQIRTDIVMGIINLDLVPFLTANELATEDVKKERDETLKNASLARRADLYQITREEVLRANGIDPNQGGEFKCGRCKGTKTTHHAMQTRCADEPMTVFVCCLTCGKRWKC